MSTDAEIIAQKEKWRIWNEQRKKEEIKKVNVEENLQNYVVKLTQKLGQPAENQKKKKENNK